MIVLALDVGTSTGWAARDGRGAVTSGRERFDVRRNESTGMRVLRFRAWLRETLDLLRPALVVYERPVLHRKQHKGQPVGFQLEAALILELEDRGIEYTAPTAAEVKRAATGKGNAGKLAVANAMEERWAHYAVPVGFDPKRGDDEADALAVLVCALDEIGER